MREYTDIGIASFHAVNKLSNIIITFTVSMLQIIRNPKKAASIWSNTSTHTAIWFKDSENNITYYEALEGHGWQGPMSMDTAKLWAESKPGRWVKLYNLTSLLSLSKNSIGRREAFCLDRVPVEGESPKGKWKYSLRQFAAMPRFASTLRKMLGASPDKVICSEAASRVCCSALFSFPERCNRSYHDYVTPEMIHEVCNSLMDPMDRFEKAQDA